MELTKQEKHELDQAIELTPEEKHECLVLDLKAKVFPAIFDLKTLRWYSAAFIDANGDHVFTFKSLKSPTLELVIKSGE